MAFQPSTRRRGSRNDMSSQQNSRSSYRNSDPLKFYPCILTWRLGLEGEPSGNLQQGRLGVPELLSKPANSRQPASSVGPTSPSCRCLYSCKHASKFVESLRIATDAERVPELGSSSILWANTSYARR